MAKDLAAIFSGWIAAIVGFYFIQGQARQTRETAEVVSREAAESALKLMDLAMGEYRDRNRELMGTIEKLGSALLQERESEPDSSADTE